jgi:hypothetical protein
MTLRVKGMISVAKARKGKGGVMEAVIGKEKRERLIDRLCQAMKPICNCVSVAARQAREAEIEVPSKRRFRQILASGEASFAIPQDAGTGLHEVVARTGIGARAFLDCLDEAKHQVEQSRTDVGTRLAYRRLPE